MARAWRLKSRPTGLPNLDNFELREFDLPDLREGEIKVRNSWVSVDPYMRGKMYEARRHTPGYELDEPMTGGGVGVVVESRSPDFAAGDQVSHLLGWRDWTVGPATAFKKIPGSNLPAQYYLHHLGMIGFTAYIGLLVVAEAEAGETLFVSAAGGSVGSAVVQIAKLKGLRVIASAGGAAKCAMVAGLGADEVIDYKAPGALSDKLASAAPKGLDLYFDNVGGEHLDAALGCAKAKARFAMCGMVSTYNDNTAPMNFLNMPRIVGQQIQLRGFMVGEFMPYFAGFRRDMTEWISTGQVRSPETIREGLEAAPSALIELFTGNVLGKMLVRL